MQRLRTQDMRTSTSYSISYTRNVDFYSAVEAEGAGILQPSADVG